LLANGCGIGRSANIVAAAGGGAISMLMARHWPCLTMPKFENTPFSDFPYPTPRATIEAFGARIAREAGEDPRIDGRMALGSGCFVKP
jgi:hypothetical protein